jgi:hypothetical protein
MRRRQRMGGRAPSRSSGLANRAKLARSVGSQRQIHLPWYRIGGARLSPQLHEADLESHDGALPWSCVAELADLGSAGGVLNGCVWRISPASGLLAELPHGLCGESHRPRICRRSSTVVACGRALDPLAELPRGYVWWSLLASARPVKSSICPRETELACCCVGAAASVGRRVSNTAGGDGGGGDPSV